MALQCAICHGSNRIGQIDTPNLEGQPAAAIYKQLGDFKIGARNSAVMGPFAVRLSEQMRNIARNMTPEEIDAAARYYAGRP